MASLRKEQTELDDILDDGPIIVNDIINEKTTDVGVTIEGALIKDATIFSAGIFGGIHIHDNATTQSIPTGLTYTKITAFADNEPSSNVTSDAANDKIIITNIGIYRVEGSFSFSAGTVNTEWAASAFLGGVEQDNVHFVRKISVAGDVGNSGFTGFIDVTSTPIDLDFRVRQDNGGSVNFTLTYGNLNVEYLGKT